ncbi:MAG: phosphatidylglycerophosphatase A [Candidatus Eisenbacteria bacterium]|jgi:phosphatidylglycerophosphatase A|nr:phosphatidylglycerophosphatase A [Candidatus Eisenbacteria bacterium]
MRRFARRISTLGPIGRSPIAPGTLGAAAAAVVGYAVSAQWGVAACGAATVVTILAGQWACTARGDAADDPGEVVIDEAAGQLIALLGAGHRPGCIVLAFGLFRLLDIWKPWPIRQVEEKGGAWAVMGDDILAGCMAGIVVLAVGFIG